MSDITDYENPDYNCNKVLGTCYCKNKPKCCFKQLQAQKEINNKLLKILKLAKECIEYYAHSKIGIEEPEGVFTLYSEPHSGYGFTMPEQIKEGKVLCIYDARKAKETLKILESIGEKVNA